VLSSSVAVIYGEPFPTQTILEWFSGALPPQAIMVGTNAERVRQIVQEWPADWPAPMVFTDKQRLPIQVDVDFPEKVGMDRLLHAVAAQFLRKSDQPVITVGSGTAITVDVVDAAGVFRGGAILPGILLGAKSLHEETTTLPHVNVWELLSHEPAVIGRNTEAAIASGLYWGHLGGVRELITRETAWLKQHSPRSPLIVLTGGASGIIAPYLPRARHLPDLALRALAALLMHHRLDLQDSGR